MQNTKEALTWITTIIKEKNIPFQITGGLAAQVYGSQRNLADIDIDIPEDNFATIINEVSPYITFGPAQYKDEEWDLPLMTLNYKDQEIDLCGAYTTKVYNKANNTWLTLKTNLSNPNHADIFGITLPVISRDELIAYKKIIARPVDLLDLAALTPSSPQPPSAHL
ncbi:MAG: hypothetical protein COZ46_00790 [Verrucomicrobia bacterium CG_4_10_14_3_um_filter_43_23]|nr:MAG: hypothetical protein AUJ82_05745 [Verrucomicrobia bacterium CG1_02_43_26]PIP58694.1 MAG: hypothetical protein COX01_07340 [Verrucomicrobia bacterium CG22_combo_CG10-13_8_21_14_all_43_17]PIX59015.1 MAG: hypothetical protein COZ46_00790 [Verrucomicrobia bacterium CG_4_10_14_3_um_filter_43_23]PIY61612.1 MAG: hypothetical protein COY94_04575 [Verrucomicrobia bacterium CG_4_10_14_0_8_um_filter_43_34]PJA44521.1 MAG: hypothetical protein CO175_02595 [Verrucomicrobia bacterium CG_4_9_14_3_um_fi